MSEASSAKKIINAKKMSRETGIPVADICRVLDVSMLEVQLLNIEEARITHHESFLRGDKDTCEKAEKKWDHFALVKARAAVTLTEIKAAFEDSRDGSEAQKIAWLKWDELGSSFEEMDEIYRASEHIQLTEEEGIAAFKKLLMSCSKLHEAKSVYFHVGGSHCYPVSRSYGRQAEDALLRWLDFCATFKDAMEIYDHTQRNSSVKAQGEKVLLKAVELLTTKEEGMRVYEIATANDKVREAVIHKLATFFEEKE